MAVAPAFSTPVTELFGIKHPVMLAGMNIVASPKLAAAVSNAGGLGVFGGVTYTPKMLRAKIEELKEELDDPSLPFGVDLLLPQVGGSARKTNYDYTHGDLPQLVDIIIELGAKLFVSAVGVPPQWVVDKFHAAGIPVMNMIGSPNHVEKCLAAGVDIICAQGGEGGGHTGEVATSILIPMVVDLCKGKISALTGKQVPVVAAGGIYDGRSLAMALSLGADAVWVGTRFIACTEAGCPKKQKEDTVKAGIHETHRSLIYTGRPMRIIKNEYSVNWEENRAQQMKELLAGGTIPVARDQAIMEKMAKGELKDEPVPVGMAKAHPWLCGQVAGAIQDILPARAIVENMVEGAAEVLRSNAAKVAWPASKL